MSLLMFRSEVKPFAMLKGLATFVPGARHFTNRGTGGTGSARYCYSVWLRHFVSSHRAGLLDRVETLGEFGPGDSIGAGLAALLSGIPRYYALDTKAHANSDANLEVFEELVDLFSKRTPIPDAVEFPWIHPVLENYGFPADLLTEDVLRDALAPQRLEAIRKILREAGDGPAQGEVQIHYIAPWDDASLLAGESIDMIISQAVMEHVNEVPAAYATMSRLLRRGGCMSHVIDYKSHGHTYRWNGHWAVSASTWKLVRGARSYLINRWPHSAHIAEIKKNQFRIAAVHEYRDEPLARNMLAREFRNLPDSDLSTAGAFIQAVKD